MCSRVCKRSMKSDLFMKNILIQMNNTQAMVLKVKAYLLNQVKVRNDCISANKDMNSCLLLDHIFTKEKQ